jgi:hypothetical protein
VSDDRVVDQAWFEMTSIRRRRLSDAVWVPLRLAEWIGEVGRIGYEGYRTEFFGLGSVAVPLARRADAEKLGWDAIGISHRHGVLASKERYTPAEVYQYCDGDDLGIELVLEQDFEGAAPSVWHINQDLIMALGLLRENDEWIRPSEDYCVVARLRRNDDGQAIACEIKNEFLRDYLAARGMALRITYYRKRELIAEEANYITWPHGRLEDTAEQHRFRARVFPILEGGYAADDAGYAVFRISRTDVDPEEDVPRPGPESDANTASESWRGQHKGKKLVRVLAELWRNEWIEPSVNSIRVRGDKVPTGIHYIVGASGERLPSESLKDDDDPRWLWFRPQVMLSLIRRRGGELKWYTQETGGVSCCAPAYSVHFGVNDAGLITVYASDIAELPTWQQQIWAGFNTTPEGGVSKELLSAQMEARVAETTAPEAILPEVLEAIDQTFIRRIGAPLFRKHPSTEGLILMAHRFRATETGGFLALAKDLARIIADRIDAAAIQTVVPPPPKEKSGSLKSLEKYLATVMPPSKARHIMSALVGAYELRVGDAHLPSSDIEEAYRLARVDSTASGLQQGFRLLASVVSSLMIIDRSLN